MVTATGDLNESITIMSELRLHLDVVADMVDVESIIVPRFIQADNEMPNGI